MTDWKLLKLQYELLGETAENIAVSNDLSTSVVEYAIDEEGWEQKPLAVAIRDWEYSDNLNDVDQGVLDEVKNRLGILEALKRSALAPQYAAVEAAILHKSLEIVKALNGDRDAAGQLKIIAEVVGSLKASNREKDAKEEKGSGVNVQIINHVEPKAA